VGHTPIMAEPLQTPCHCGNTGCWEVYANQDSILRRVRSILEENEDSIIHQLMVQSGEPLTIALIKEAADAGDPLVLEALRETGVAMGIGLVTLINILNPEMIIMGGPLSTVGTYLLPGIEESAARFAFPATKPEFEIMISAFGRDSSLIGAASIVVDHVLSNPIQVERR